MNEARDFEDDPAWQDGYDHACAVTNELLGTLMEDVEQYHRLYLRMARQYEAHMQACSQRSESRAAVAGGAP